MLSVYNKGRLYEGYTKGIRRYKKGQSPISEGVSILPRGDEAFHCVGKAMYLYCPHGYGRTKLTNNTLERLLTVSGTTRNWRTVSKIYEMATVGNSWIAVGPIFLWASTES